MDETKPTAPSKAKASKRTYLIQARHSPCVIKRLEIEASSEEEAVDIFWRRNVEAASSRVKTGPALVKLIEAARRTTDLVVTPK